MAATDLVYMTLTTSKKPVRCSHAPSGLSSNPASSSLKLRPTCTRCISVTCTSCDFTISGSTLLLHVCTHPTFDLCSGCHHTSHVCMYMHVWTYIYCICNSSRLHCIKGSMQTHTIYEIHPPGCEYLPCPGTLKSGRRSSLRVQYSFSDLSSLAWCKISFGVHLITPCKSVF